MHEDYRDRPVWVTLWGCTDCGTVVFPEVTREDPTDAPFTVCHDGRDLHACKSREGV